MGPLHSSNDDPVFGLNQFTRSHTANRTHCENDCEESIWDAAGGVRVKNRSRKAKCGEGCQRGRERASVIVFLYRCRITVNQMMAQAWRSNGDRALAR